MDINDFLRQGTWIKNPDYRKPTKNDPGTPQFIRSNTYEQALDYGDKLGQHLAANTYDLSNINKGNEQWGQHGVHVNPVNTLEELERERAKNQGLLEENIRMSGQMLGSEIVLGTALGIFNLVDAIANIGKGAGENDYTNPVSTFLEDTQNKMRDRLAIYKEDPNKAFAILDSGWWASNLVSAASTVSLMIPAMGVTKVLSIAGKLSKLGKLSNLISKASAVTGGTRSAARIASSINAATKIGMNAVISRTAENYQEARQTYTEVYDDIRERIKELSTEDRQAMIERNPEMAEMSDDDMAKYIAGRSADKTFKDDYVMLLMDIMQFKAIGSLWRGMPSKTASGALRRANQAAVKGLTGTAETAATTATRSATKSATKAAENPIRRFFSNRAEEIKYGLKHPLSSIEAMELGEGVEEGYQGIQSEKGKEVAEMMLDPNFNRRTIGSYLKDGTIWEQAFFGVIGGIAFKGAGSAIGNTSRKIENRRLYKQGKISEEDFKLNLDSEEKIRLREIQGRKERNDKFIAEMNLLNTRKDEGNENNPYKDLTDEEAEIRKAQLTDGYLTSMTLDAIESGNYDLLKAYLQDPAFNEYFNKSGIDLAHGDKQFGQYALDRMEAIANYYSTNLNNILSNTNVDNRYIAQLAARDITYAQLEIDELNEMYDNLENQINTDNNTGVDPLVIRAYRRQQMKQFAEDLKKDRQNGLETVKNSISKQAYEKYKKEFDEESVQLDEWLNSEQEIELTSIPDDAVNKLPKAIKDSVNKQVGISFRRFQDQQSLPTTNADYQKIVAEKEDAITNFATKKQLKAVQHVIDYVTKQDDMAAAYEKVIAGEIEETEITEDDLDALALGHSSTQHYQEMIAAAVRSEQKKRDKQRKEEKKARNNGAITGRSKASNQQQNQQLQQPQQPTQPQQNAQQNQQPQQQPQPQPQQAPTNSNQNTNPPISSEQVSPDKGSAEIIIDDFGEEPQPSPEELAAIESSARGLDEVVDLAEEDIAAMMVKPSKSEEDTDMATSVAMKAVIDIYKTSPNLIDNAISEEGKQTLAKLVEEQVNSQLSKFPEADISEAIERGMRSASRIIKLKKDRDKNSLAAITSDIFFNENLEENILKLLNAYKERNKIYTRKGKKTTINLERFLNDLVNDENITPELAKLVLYNMQDFIKSNNTGNYKFTKIKAIQNALKDPTKFAALVKPRESRKAYRERVASHMHISPSTQNRSNEADRAINGIRGGEQLTVEYTRNAEGEPVSIHFKLNGTEIGYVALVTPNATNTGFIRRVSHKSGGIQYNVTRDSNGNYASDTDNLFDALLDDENEDLFDLIYKVAVDAETLTEEEESRLFNSDLIQQAINDEIIVFPEKGHDSISDKVNFIINSLSGVLFYDELAESKLDYRESYEKWIERIYINSRNVYDIQQRLDKGETVSGAISSVTQGREGVTPITTSEEHGINSIQLDAKQNSVVGIVQQQDGSSRIVNENDKTVAIDNSGLSVGNMGMWIAGTNDNPILALFTSANKLSTAMSSQVESEIGALITEYLRDPAKGYETLKNALSNLLGTKNLFNGYIVVSDDSTQSIGLINANRYKKDSNKHEYDLIINSKGVLLRQENGKFVRITSSNHRRFADIGKTIASNLTYNKTFFTLNNFGDNTDNPYMQKKDGKFIVKIGGTETVYDSFGDFVLKENAFNTIQGQNKDGGYFNISEKAQSINVNVASMLNPQVESNAEQVTNNDSAIKDEITSAGVTEKKQRSTSDLLKKAGFSNAQISALTGDNVYRLSVVAHRYGYKPSLGKGVKAAYQKATSRAKARILFSNSGVNAIIDSQNSKQTLLRLLVHESIHARVDELSTLDREGIVDELIETYHAAVNAVDSILNDKNADTKRVEYQRAQRIRKFFDEFNYDTITASAKTEQEKQRLFVEEWLAESLSQPVLMEFLNTTAYTSGVDVSGIQNENKSIFQKLIDLLLKIFNVDHQTVQNNTIFARQYQILGNIEANSGSEQNNAQESIQSENANPTAEEVETTEATETTEETTEKANSTEESTEDEELVKDEDNEDDDADYDYYDNSDYQLDAITSDIADIEESRIDDFIANDGNTTAETFGITRITNMADYVNIFAPQDRVMVQRMLNDGEIKYVCHI